MRYKSSTHNTLFPQGYGDPDYLAFLQTLEPNDLLTYPPSPGPIGPFNSDSDSTLDLGLPLAPLAPHIPFVDLSSPPTAVALNTSTQATEPDLISTSLNKDPAIDTCNTSDINKVYSDV